MKERAADESLSEETREAAQKALDELVSAQIEQDRAQSRRIALEATISAEQFTVAELLGVAYVPLEEDLKELGVETAEDMKELEAEHIETLAAKLKVVQAKKFVKKIAALQAA